MHNRSVWWGLACIGLLIWVGCDGFGAENNTIEIRRTLEFRFAFDADSVVEGETVLLQSAEQVNLAGQLDGFDKSDLKTARVESAKLVALFPLSESIAYLEQVILSFDAPPISPLEIASQARFPAERNVNLDLASSRDVVAFIQVPAFGTTLRIVAIRRSLLPNMRYELAVEVVVVMQAEIKT